MSHSCPSCGAPLDNEGICTSCGALARGVFGALDLGVPQIADAVRRGLDFYRLLEVQPDADIRVVARRYRQLRAHFPDDPARLTTVARRRLALLDVAGRTLTDPQLRHVYDQLRGRPDARIETAVVRCVACGAPLAPDLPCCTYCAAPRPVLPATPAARPPDGATPPPAEPVDYYALLGLTPTHLFVTPATVRLTQRGHILDSFWDDRDDDDLPPRPHAPPSPGDVDEAALARTQAVLLTPHLPTGEREAYCTEIEIARRLLRDDRQRGIYDGLLRAFQAGKLDNGRLDGLRALQDWARTEIAIERGDAPSTVEGAALLRQGLGYLEARLPREAVPLLARAVVALPQSCEAHTAYIRALLAAEDPLDASPHTLRQLLRSIEALDTGGAPLTNSVALGALARGLLARANGDARTADAELHAAVQHDSQLAPAWRGLAALALARTASDEASDYARRALALDDGDERALLLLAAACGRAGRRAEARECAIQLAALRGAEWSAERVLAELC